MATPTVETKIWLALRARVETISLGMPYTVVWPGRNTDVPQGIGLEVTHLVNRPLRRALKGTNPHVREGILQIGVLVATGETNPSYPQEIAGDVADHFPVDVPLRYDDIAVQVYEAPEVGGGFFDEQRQRFVTPVSIRWRTFC